MTREEIYNIWAPLPGVWSPWVKPVLFAHLQPSADLVVPVPEHAVDISWAKGADGSTAFVIDLPNAHGVLTGLALAELGYRPVPLYNAAPGPLPRSNDSAWSPHLPAGGGAMVPVRPIIAAIISGSALLAELKLPYGAPPAFLLDAGRRIGAPIPIPGEFDNRSVSFPTDFPSASFLMSRGIKRAIVLQPSGWRWTTAQGVQPDIAHTLRRWQDAGITLESKMLNTEGPPVPFTIRRSSRLRELGFRIMAALQFKRNPLGGFGGTLAEPGSGG